MNPSASPARLHVLMAREAPFGLILRRGPRHQVCTIGWNRTDDTFALGQWLRARISELESDLSPDGRHFIYSAARYKPGADIGHWTALSRAPFLKAIGFWPRGDTRLGGGFFPDKKTFWLNAKTVDKQLPDGLTRAMLDVEWHFGIEAHDVFALRLRRDGWMLQGTSVYPRQAPAEEVLWTKTRNAWTLSQFMRSDSEPPPSRGHSWQWFRANNVQTGEILGDQSWEWADFDGDRLVWAQHGKLFATKIWDGGHGDIIELADFNDWKFKNIIAPY